MGKRGKQAVVETGMREGAQLCVMWEAQIKSTGNHGLSLYMTDVDGWRWDEDEKDEILSQTGTLRELRPQPCETDLGNWLFKWFFYGAAHPRAEDWHWDNFCSLFPLKKRLHSVGTAPHNMARRRSILHKHFCSEVVFLIWDTRSYSW